MGGTRALLRRELRQAYSWGKADGVHPAKDTHKELWELAAGGRGPDWVRVGKVGIAGTGTPPGARSLLASLVFKGDGASSPLRIQVRHHSLGWSHSRLPLYCPMHSSVWEYTPVDQDAAQCRARGTALELTAWVLIPALCL